MGVGIGAKLVLELHGIEGKSRKLLGSITVPTKLAAELNASGGAELQLEWVDTSTSTPEALASAPMPTLSALKGSLG